jgi:hypothetical protein
LGETMNRGEALCAAKRKNGIKYFEGRNFGIDV